MDLGRCAWRLTWLKRQLAGVGFLHGARKPAGPWEVIRKSKFCADHASLSGVPTRRDMAYANIEAILDDGGNISVGRVAGECVAAASTSYDCPVMLVRRDGESFAALLKRLDRSIGKAWDNETIIDEING
jgi:hypothetical protein